MPSPIDKPLLTRLYEDWDSFELEPESTFVHGTSVETRSIHPETWECTFKDVNFVRFSSHENPPKPDFSRCTAEMNGAWDTLQLRGGDQLRTFFLKIESKTIYLDITGLPHHVWAPLLRAALAASNTIPV